IYCCNARRNEDSPNRISLDRHSSLTDLTQRSAYAFRFGLLAGNRSGFTFPVLISSRKDWKRESASIASKKRIHVSRPDQFSKGLAELRISVMQQIAAASQASPLLHRHVSRTDQDGK